MWSFSEQQTEETNYATWKGIVPKKNFWKWRFSIDKWNVPDSQPKYALALEVVPKHL